MTMHRRTEMDLMRLLHGELPPERAAELRGRLDREPDLAERYRRLAADWEGLALPPPASPPPGFSGRVMAHVRGAAAEGTTLSWSLAPTWVRAAAAAALVAGLALGAELGLLPSGRSAETFPGTLAMGEREPLADSYWSVFEEETPAAARPASPGGEARP
jgi:anti-sigma factor RsiW